MVRRMLDGVETLTGTDFCKQRDFWLGRAPKIVYTGMIDELMDYRFGALDYRGLEFHTERVDVSDYQGIAVINETSPDVPYTPPLFAYQAPSLGEGWGGCRVVG